MSRSTLSTHRAGSGARPPRPRRRFLPAAAALLASLLLPVPGAAQQAVGFEGRLGVGLPAFDLADRVDAGLAVGLDLSYALSSRVSLVAGGDVEFLNGGDDGTGAGGPDLDVWHYGAGLEAQLLDPVMTYWRLSLGGGLGGTTFDGVDGGGSRTELSTFGILELGYEVSPEADVYLSLRSYLAFTGDGTDTTASDGDVLAGVGDTAWSFPVMAGLRFHF